MNITELAVKAGFDVDEGLFPFEATEDKYIGTERALEDFAELIRDEVTGKNISEYKSEQMPVGYIYNDITYDRIPVYAAPVQPVKQELVAYEDPWNPKSCSFCGMMKGHAKTCRNYAAPVDTATPGHCVDAKAIRAEALEEAKEKNK